MKKIKKGVHWIWLGLIVALWYWAPWEKEQVIETFPSVSARQGNLKITLDLIGELDSLQHDFVTSTFHGQIDFLASEGMVQENDLLIRLSKESIEEKLENAQENLDTANYNLQNAMESIGLQRVQSENNVELAESRLVDAEASHNRRQVEVGEGLRPAVDLESTAFSLLQAEQGVEESRLSLQTKESQWALEIRQKELQVVRREEEVLRYEEELGATEIFAHRDGLVVHVESWYGSWRKPKEGDNISPNRSVLDFPDISTFLVMVKISERDVHKVKEGQPVEISVDALPGQLFTGVVQSISQLATSDMGTGSITFSAQGESKGFRAEILLDPPTLALSTQDSEAIPTPSSDENPCGLPPFVMERMKERGMDPATADCDALSSGRRGERGGGGERSEESSSPIEASSMGGRMRGESPNELDRVSGGLRPGMTALSRILIQEVVDVVVLPRSAVFLLDGQTVGYKVVKEGWIRVGFSLGAVGPQEAEVAQGAVAGERFLIVSPEEDATSTAPDGTEASSPSPSSPMGGGGSRRMPRGRRDH